MSKPIPFKRRLRVLERDGWACVYCGVGLVDIRVQPEAYKPVEEDCFALAVAGVMEAEIDHDIPKSRGGSNLEDNLVASCGPCNNRKKTRTAEEFRRDMGERQ